MEPTREYNGLFVKNICCCFVFKNITILLLLQIRCPLIELSCIMVDGHAEWHAESLKGTSVDLVKHRVAHPRYIRSHLPLHLLPVDIENQDGSIKPKVGKVRV